MKNKISINLKAFVLFVLLILTIILTTNANAVLVPKNWSLIPENANLGPGNAFRLLFVTASTTLPTATQINYYNDFVIDAASNNILLRPFANEFRALASTADVDARDNTNTHPNAQIPIYFLGGHKVADNYTDFYDGSWDLPSPNTHPSRASSFGTLFYFYNEYGATTTNNVVTVWTGTNFNGIRAISPEPGNPNNNINVWLGLNTFIIRSLNVSGNEIREAALNSHPPNPLYGLSPLIRISVSESTYTISTLTLKDDNPAFVIRGTDYQDPSVSAMGISANGSVINVSSDTIITSNNLNTEKLGHYQIIYKAADTQGNIKTATRNIYVVLNNFLDIDNNKIIRANQDGLMIWHYLLGGKDENYIKRAVGKNPKIATPSVLLAYVKHLADNKILDIDASRKTDSEDGKLILKYLIGFRNYNLTSGLNLTGTRTLAASITNYFENILTPLDWREATSNAQWEARQQQSSVVFNKKMWILGGFFGSRLNDIWSSENGEDWQQIAAATTTTATWQARRDHSSVDFKGQMWVLGGHIDNVNVNDIWRSTNGKDWQQIKTATTAIWSERRDQSSVVFQNKMWVIGGSGNSRLDDVWSSAEGVTWTRVATGAWSARFAHSSVVFNKQMWILGGHDGRYKNDVWYSNASGTIWKQATETTAATAIWSERRDHSSVVFDDKIWIFGGYDGSKRLNDVWFSEDGVHWQQQYPRAPWSARRYLSAVVLNNKIWIFGGQSSDSENDVWSFGNQVQRHF